MPDLRYMSLSPRYLVAVNLVLLALAAYSASAIVGTALAARFAHPPDVEISAPPAPIPEQGSRPPSFYALIEKRDIFNSAKPAVEVTDTGVAEVPLTPLRLKLWGVALHEGDESYCIIEDEKKRTQAVYAIDDEVPGGATVKAVEWDRIVLLHGGREEVLELQEVGTIGSGNSGRSSASSGRSSSTASRGPAVPAVTGVKMVSDDEYVVDREEVDNALENMNQLFTQIRAVPHFEGGESTGFRLFAIRRGSLFDKIGLKNGDIIRNINGKPIDDPTKALAMLEQLRNVSNLNVEVTRNRQPKTLTYTVE
jgi:general secretion pathway protein C